MSSASPPLSPLLSPLSLTVSVSPQTFQDVCKAYLFEDPNLATIQLSPLVPLALICARLVACVAVYVHLSDICQKNNPRCPASCFHLSRTPVSRPLIPHHDQRRPTPISPLTTRRCSQVHHAPTRRLAEFPRSLILLPSCWYLGYAKLPSRRVCQLPRCRDTDVPSCRAYRCHD
jgi:hypothetical protein